MDIGAGGPTWAVHNPLVAGLQAAGFLGDWGSGWSRWDCGELEVPAGVKCFKIQVTSTV